MTREETKEFMRRIKQHYQEFAIDDYKVSEWYKALSEYDYKEINDKLDEHLKSETYGNEIPKVYFLTKYLKTIKEKEKNNYDNIKVECNICHEYIPYNEYDKHFERESSVKYFIKKYKEYYGKDLDKEQLMNMDKETFQHNYTKMLGIIKQNTKNKYELYCINKMFENKEIE